MKKPILILLVLLSFFSQSAFAEVSYDKYAPVYSEKQTGLTKAGRTLAHLPVYPFELVRYPVNKTLVAVEKYHIDKKVQWIYEWLDSYGVNPKLGLLNPSQMRIGSDFDFARMFRLKQKYPNFVLDSGINYAGDDLFQTGAEVGFERIADTGFEVKSLVDYSDRHQEHFYGIGPDTSQGEGHVYEREETLVQGLLGYNFDFIKELNVITSYKNVNISGGKDGGRGQFNSTEVFNESVVDGIHGDELFAIGTEFKRDTRNQKENSTAGGLQRVGFSFNEGLYGSDARFFRYELEGTQYFSLGSNRRVLVLHGFGEHNNEADSHYVPFHQMPRLGGHGTSYRLSQTLRGFDNNRFTDATAALFNIEYRYTIWEYRDFKTDTVFFWDEGQTFGDFSDFQMKDFRESYGFGFRVSLANVVILSTEIAHGDEGTNLYVKSSAPF